jgi:hypothetical protein
MRYNILMDEAKLAAILQEYATTSIPLNDILAQHRISTATFFKKRDSNPLIENAYQRARERRADTLVDESLRIADKDLDAARARNRIGARQWAAARLNRRSYGDQIDVTSGGEPLSLVDARQRALSARPMRDQHEVSDAQVVEYIPRVQALVPGYTPGTAETEDASIVQGESQPADSIDPFS